MPAPDARELLAGLEAYRETVDRHLDAVRTEFDSLAKSWLWLDECYAGNAADEFRAVWEAASERFRDYVEQSTGIVRVLAGRIEELRTADLTGGLS